MVGATQSGKTSSIVIPAILEWPGAVVVASVKRDILDVTSKHRQELGNVEILEPGLDDGKTWNPLEGISNYRQAMRVAQDMAVTTGESSDGTFWNNLAVKLLGTLFAIAIEHGQSIFDVVRVLESRNFEPWAFPERSTNASETLANLLKYEPKTLDSICVTTESMVLPWRFPQPAARVREVLQGSNSLFMCSPKGQQLHYEPLFRGALRMILDEQQRLVDARVQQKLLVVLDEAASVSSLDDLDLLAATVSGLDVTLLTVVQDFGQLTARWGPKASTIVNNHTTRLIFGGLSDPSAISFVPELKRGADEKPETPLRELSAGRAVLVANRRPAALIKTLPWWRSAHLRGLASMT